MHARIHHAASFKYILRPIAAAAAAACSALAGGPGQVSARSLIRVQCKLEIYTICYRIKCPISALRTLLFYCLGSGGARKTDKVPHQHQQHALHQHVPHQHHPVVSQCMGPGFAASLHSSLSESITLRFVERFTQELHSTPFSPCSHTGKCCHNLSQPANNSCIWQLRAGRPSCTLAMPAITGWYGPFCWLCSSRTCWIDVGRFGPLERRSNAPNSVGQSVRLVAAVCRRRQAAAAAALCGTHCD